MTARPHGVVPPVTKRVRVPWDQAAAFRRFTTDVATWWPLRTHSVGGSRTETCVFEEQVGGQIYERLTGGGRAVWGTVLVWEPPGRVVYTWHPGRPPETAGEVEVRFVPERGGARVEVVHAGWERFGANARRARNAYTLGWSVVLDVYAGRRGAKVRFLNAAAQLMMLPGRLRRSARAYGG